MTVRTSELTEKERQEFWEWCGWKWLSSLQCWESPDTTQVRLNKKGIYKMPIDLNSLFSYAVPKVLDKIGREKLIKLVLDALCKAIELKVKLEDTLFWAIYEVIK